MKPSRVRSDTAAAGHARKPTYSELLEKIAEMRAGQAESKDYIHRLESEVHKKSKHETADAATAHRHGYVQGRLREIEKHFEMLCVMQRKHQTLDRDTFRRAAYMIESAIKDHGLNMSDQMITDLSSNVARLDYSITIFADHIHSCMTVNELKAVDEQLVRHFSDEALSRLGCAIVECLLVSLEHREREIKPHRRDAGAYTDFRLSRVLPPGSRRRVTISAPAAVHGSRRH
ncbi:hypothetical protein K402DRAFT_422607 [Aulographum hederae CBS 113979]|uniref:Uncharacterized protein n=1 Tax=Aulographum hederae CBS 113979 TaxID=1176131 RepID=A0A6G1GV71_9PEZI|nr:hypothetical protein K402DRAFT_422607 [Aulographum hederae CBS 113979]